MRSKQLLCLAFLFVAVLFFLSPQNGYPASRKSRSQDAADKTGAARGGGKQTPAEPGKATGAATDLSPGQINARSAVLLEVSTGTVLFEQNADEPIEPASFTKVATLYLIFEALKADKIHLNDDVWVSETAWRTGGSKMFVGIGSKIPLEEVIKGIAVVSGNDSCIAAAEHLSGSVDTFVDALNRKAKELGMNRTRFLNPHGLPADGQITTAHDMATLDLAYLRNFPEALRFHSMREFTYNNIVQYNRNHLLLKDPTVDGLKTGYIAASGYHLSATSQRDGMRLLAVVMGAATPAIREREAMKLLNFGFRNYSLVAPFPDGQPIAKATVWKGQKDDVQLFPKEKATFLIPQGQKNLLRWDIKAPADVTAPIKAGQELGELVFLMSDQPKRTVSLVSNEDIPLGSFTKRAWHSLAAVYKIDWRLFSVVMGGVAALFILVMVLMGIRSSKGGKVFKKGGKS